MLYVTGTNGDNKVTLFETHTNSSITVTRNRLGKLVNKYNMTLANAKIEADGLKINIWPRDMSGWRTTREYRGMLLVQVEENVFKIMYNNKARYVYDDTLKRYIDEGELENCSFSTVDGVTQYMSKDTYRVEINKKFKKHIDEEYAKFISKSKMLGIDNEFEYSVEGKEVILFNYEGTSNRVALPNFITSISAGAFSGKKVETVKLNLGLQYIGTKAFTGNDMGNIVIPETVKFMCDGAFDNKCRLELRSKKTLILDIITGGYK